ncbi:hypothetical protein Tco_1075243 [Tanacetum coccineum]
MELMRQYAVLSHDSLRHDLIEKVLNGWDIVVCALIVYISWYQEPKFLIKMPPKRNSNINDVYEQEFKQRFMTRMVKRLDQFVDQLADRMDDIMNPRRRGDRNGRRSKGEESENPFFEGDGSSSDEQPNRPRRNQKEYNRRWESRMRVNILVFDRDTLFAEPKE